MKSKTAEKWLTTAQKIFVRWSPADSGAVALCPRPVVQVIRIPAAMDIWIRVTDLRLGNLKRCTVRISANGQRKECLLAPIFGAFQCVLND